MFADRDKKITIMHPSTDVSTQNEYGEQTAETAYVTVAENIWASVSPIRGKEYWQAEQIQSKVSTRIELDYILGIDSSMRVLYGSRVFNIVAVIDLKEMHRTLQLMCEEIEP
jgi:SPP1 family predicted phage head-tail adaptor